MKKLIVAVLLITVLFTGTVRAQTVDVQTQYQTLLVQLINLLMQQVSALQAQLTELQASVQTLSTPVQPPSTPPALTTGTTVAPAPTNTATSTPEVPKTVTVKQIDITHLQIVNDTGVAVRIKNIAASSTLADMNISGSSIWYPRSFKGMDATYNIFDCSGLGSLGTYPSYGNANTDPCVRRDENLPRNELQPGETMTLRFYDPVDITNVTGTIVEVGTGKDVQFSGL
jgi:hypothetical protein